MAAGVWRRDFERGVAIVNALDQTKTVALGGEYEKLTGIQAPEVNDGSIVTSVTIAAKDGLILMKTVSRIVGVPFRNGAFARVYSANGERLRNGFFAYEAPFDGSATVVAADLDGDGSEERVVGGAGVVTIYKKDGAVKASFRPYGDRYALPVNFAVGDLEGDGRAEIVTGGAAGGGPHVRVFNADGVLINPGFFAYDPRFRGGVRVALGDLYGTGRDVIIVGAGLSGGPHVRVFAKNGRLLDPGFFAYDPSFRGGVSVAAGDVDGDGRDEIVTGAGPGGAPHVRVFRGNGAPIGRGFFAGERSSTGGVDVAAFDADGDGQDEIAAFTTDVFQVASAR